MIKTKITTLICLACFTINAFAKDQAAVAMPDSYSAEIAADILNKGGNAVDAAVAAQFVLAVTLPEAGNIGGGGFMLIYKDKKAEFLDYREQAPLMAHRDMYLNEDGDVIQGKSLFGVLASGVPGTVDGMWQAHQKHGLLPWKTLVQPAVELAKNGFIVHEKLAKGIQRISNYYKKNNIAVNFDDYFLSAESGKVFKQPELANTLARIREHGKAGFYQGKTADIIVEFMKKHSGIISHKDLVGYQAKWREPLQKNWKEYQLITSPPPSSGGIAILQWLNMYQLLADKNIEHNSVPYIHLLSEIGKRVFADRAEYLGDPDFIKVPVSELISDDYIKTRVKGVDLVNISNTEKITPGLKESEDTTHFSIIDQWGNAVSNTTTINISFGSGMVVSDAGFLLNDEMDDFSIKAGVPNVFGAVGGKANEIQPKKRMLSSMTPTIVLKDGEISLVTGSPGGTTIITSVYQSILNTLAFGMSAQEAVDATRFHHQLLPINEIRHHEGLTAETKKQLQAKGYNLKSRHFGDLHLILRRGESIEGASQKSGRGQSIVIN
jgi:gamma-glutamyltranspeptidase/glutathione hydrolase